MKGILSKQGEQWQVETEGVAGFVLALHPNDVKFISDDFIGEDAYKGMEVEFEVVEFVDERELGLVWTTTYAKLTKRPDHVPDVREKVKMIDPPSGWMYGFPKPIPNDVKNVNEWLVANGYPQSEIDKFGDYFFCRYWETEKSENPIIPETNGNNSEKCRMLDMEKLEKTLLDLNIGRISVKVAKSRILKLLNQQ